MRLLILLLLVPMLLFAEDANLRYRVELSGLWDSNIGQNIMEESSLYGTPEVSVMAQVPLGKTDLLAGSGITYENYLQKRLATLNAPFLSPYLGVRRSFGRLRSTAKGKLAVYYSHSFKVAKTSYRFTLDNRIKLAKRAYLHVNGGAMYNDYALTSSDGMRYTTMLSFEKRFKRNILTGLEPYFDGEFNRAKSDTASYDQVEVGINSDCDLSIFDASFSVAVKSKTYGAAYEHPHTTEMITPQNRYALASLGISKTIKKLRLSLNGKLRFKDSNNPTMDYDRHTIGVSIRWSDTFFKR